MKRALLPIIAIISLMLSQTVLAGISGPPVTASVENVWMLLISAGSIAALGMVMLFKK
ncbi:MAG: hypothetical protein IMF12_04330 [Proteobacteria bacterium]|nr:hypothetical protein [Pseudomonadota bacterium]